MYTAPCKRSTAPSITYICTLHLASAAQPLQPPIHVHCTLQAPHSPFNHLYMYAAHCKRSTAPSTTYICTLHIASAAKPLQLPTAKAGVSHAYAPPQPTATTHTEKPLQPPTAPAGIPHTYAPPQPTATTHTHGKALQQQAQQVAAAVFPYRFKAGQKQHLVCKQHTDNRSKAANVGLEILLLTTRLQLQLHS
jgi:hypothetical protein